MYAYAPHTDLPLEQKKSQRRYVESKGFKPEAYNLTKEQAEQKVLDIFESTEILLEIFEYSEL